MSMKRPQRPHLINLPSTEALSIQQMSRSVPTLTVRHQRTYTLVVAKLIIFHRHHILLWPAATIYHTLQFLCHRCPGCRLEHTKKTEILKRVHKLFPAISPPIALRLYTLTYWPNPPFLIFDIRALWRSGLSARVPEYQKLK